MTDNMDELDVDWDALNEQFKDEFLEAADVPIARHTLLEVWTQVLSNVKTERKKKITMQDTATALARNPHLRVPEVVDHFMVFYDILEEAAEILASICESNPTYKDHVEDDGEFNRESYLNILILWQQMLKLRADDWSPLDPDATAVLSGHTAAASMLLGEQGLIGHLREIEFKYSAEDADMIREAVYGVEEGQ